MSDNEWTCPLCGLVGDHLRSPDPQRCRTCLKVDAAEDLYRACQDAAKIATSYYRNRAELVAALNLAGAPVAWLAGWEPKFDRILAALKKAEGR